MDPPRRRPSAADQPAGRPAGGPGHVAAGRDGAAGQAADGHQPARRIGGLEALTNRPVFGPDPTGSTCPPWWSAAPPTSWSPGDGRRHGRQDPGCRAGHHRRRRPPGDPGAARGGQPGRGSDRRSTRRRRRSPWAAPGTGDTCRAAPATRRSCRPAGRQAPQRSPVKGRARDYQPSGFGRPVGLPSWRPPPNDRPPAAGARRFPRPPAPPRSALRPAGRASEAGARRSSREMCIWE
jgi:hypothetical protein